MQEEFSCDMDKRNGQDSPTGDFYSHCSSDDGDFSNENPRIIDISNISEIRARGGISDDNSNTSSKAQQSHSILPEFSDIENDSAADIFDDVEEGRLWTNAASNSTPGGSQSTSEIPVKSRPRRRYYCAGCDYSISKNSILDKHIRMNHKELLRCKQCGYDAATTELLKRHIKTSHATKPVFTCGHCEYKCTRRFTLKQHFMTAHTKDDPLRCGVCSKKFKIRQSIQVHMQVAHPGVISGDMSFDCPECPYWTDNMENLKGHISVFHESLSTFNQRREATFSELKEVLKWDQGTGENPRTEESHPHSGGYNKSSSYNPDEPVTNNQNHHSRSSNEDGCAKYSRDESEPNPYQTVNINELTNGIKQHSQPGFHQQNQSGDDDPFLSTFQDFVENFS